ncbi:hypothetical protein [Kitasatospora sp. NPDC056531]|uniref:hypothetical protein n=1 Tax=Kitasatospora sp. NPDC056531 TaxID=3345856 RepID=UPI00368DD16A
MPDEITAFLHARLDEDADLARRCDGGDDCGTWTANRSAVDARSLYLHGPDWDDIAEELLRRADALEAE